MTGIPADNNFKDFLKVDLFTLKISRATIPFLALLASF